MHSEAITTKQSIPMLLKSTCNPRGDFPTWQWLATNRETIWIVKSCFAALSSAPICQQWYRSERINRQEIPTAARSLWIPAPLIFGRICYGKTSIRCYVQPRNDWKDLTGCNRHTEFCLAWFAEDSHYPPTKEGIQNNPIRTMETPPTSDRSCNDLFQRAVWEPLPATG